MEIIWVTILSTVANGDRQADHDDDGMVPALATGEGGVSLGATPVRVQPDELDSEKLETEAGKLENEAVHS